MMLVLCPACAGKISLHIILPSENTIGRVNSDLNDSEVGAVQSSIPPLSLSLPHARHLLSLAWRRFLFFLSSLWLLSLNCITICFWHLQEAPGGLPCLSLHLSSILLSQVQLFCSVPHILSATSASGCFTCAVSSAGFANSPLCN